MICPKCEIDKSSSLFWKSRTRKNGLQVYCISCCLKNRIKGYSEYQRNYYKKNKVKYQNYHFKSRYNLTLKERNQMIIDHKNRCDICECMFQSDYLQIDHDHATGRVRGILCSPCNRAVGFAEKRWENLKKYLEKANAIKRYKRCCKATSGCVVTNNQ